MLDVTWCHLCGCCANKDSSMVDAITKCAGQCAADVHHTSIAQINSRHMECLGDGRVVIRGI